MKIPEVIKNRDAYISRIKPFMRQSIVKVMTGHRRVGKSYILYQIMEVIRKEDTTANIIYINKEDVEFADMRTYKEFKRLCYLKIG